MTGLEVELNLVDATTWRPSLSGRGRAGRASAPPEFQSELGRWNLELNLPPRPLPGDQWRHLEHQLLDELAMARAKARDCGAQLAVIGILPTLAHRHLVEDALSPDDRYPLLNEQMLSRARRADPARHHRRRPARRPAPEHLVADFDSIAPEAACTSMQLHLQVAPGGVRRVLERRAVPGGRAARPSARTRRSCSARGCGRRPASRCSSSPATCARPSCATRACGRGCGSASGGSPRSSTCSRRTAATSRR